MRQPFLASNGATKPVPFPPPENPAHAMGHLSEPGKAAVKGIDRGKRHRPAPSGRIVPRRLRTIPC